MQVTVGEHTINYKIPEMKFQDWKGLLRVVRGQHTYPNQVVTCNSMRYILSHGDIEWAVECHITYPNPNIKVFEHPKEIEKLLKKYEIFIRDLPHCILPNRGVEHNIFSEEGTSPIQITPHRHPKKFRDEITYVRHHPRGGWKSFHLMKNT